MPDDSLARQLEKVVKSLTAPKYRKWILMLAIPGIFLIGLFFIDSTTATATETATTAAELQEQINALQEQINALVAVAAEDIAALIAAVEQLAIDLAAQGTRLATAEIDVAFLGDDVIFDGARIDDLEAAVNRVMMEKADLTVVQELQDQIAALAVAAANAALASAAADAAISDAIDALALDISAISSIIEQGQ